MTTCFSMTHQNSAGKVAIKQRSCEAEPIAHFHWFGGSATSLEAAKLNQANINKLLSLTEKVLQLIKVGGLEESIMLYSYVASGGNIFTPYHCLKSQYCVGICHNTGQFKVVSYGELFCDYQPVKRNDKFIEVYETIISKKSQEIGYNLPPRLGVCPCQETPLIS